MITKASSLSQVKNPSMEFVFMGKEQKVKLTPQIRSLHHGLNMILIDLETF